MVATNRPTSEFAGRSFLSVLFLMSGIDKIGAYAATAAYGLAGRTNDRKHQTRRRSVTGIHGIARDPHRARVSFRLPAVRIDVELRKVARRDIEPDAVTRLEQVAVANGSIVIRNTSPAPQMSDDEARALSRSAETLRNALATYVGSPP